MRHFKGLFSILLATVLFSLLVHGIAAEKSKISGVQQLHKRQPLLMSTQEENEAKRIWDANKTNPKMLDAIRAHPDTDFTPTEMEQFSGKSAGSISFSLATEINKLKRKNYETFTTSDIVDLESTVNSFKAKVEDDRNKLVKLPDQLKKMSELCKDSTTICVPRKMLEEVDKLRDKYKFYSLAVLVVFLPLFSSIASMFSCCRNNSKEMALSEIPPPTSVVTAPTATPDPTA